MGGGRQSGRRTDGGSGRSTEQAHVNGLGLIGEVPKVNDRGAAEGEQALPTTHGEAGGCLTDHPVGRQDVGEGSLTSAV